VEGCSEIVFFEDGVFEMCLEEVGKLEKVVAGIR
jgi:hypothetical protein